MELVEADAVGVNIITAWNIKNACSDELSKAPLHPFNTLNKPSAFVKTPVILIMHNYLENLKNKLFIQQANM